jgi:hypothetical protein
VAVPGPVEVIVTVHAPRPSVVQTAVVVPVTAPSLTPVIVATELTRVTSMSCPAIGSWATGTAASCSVTSWVGEVGQRLSAVGGSRVSV